MAGRYLDSMRWRLSRCVFLAVTASGLVSPAWTQVADTTAYAGSRASALSSAMVPARIRGSIAGPSASESNRFAGQNRGNFKIGQATLSISSGFDVELNDNVNFSATNRVADLILRPQVDFTLDWVVTQKNRLTLNLGMQYEKYLSSQDQDDNGFNLNPHTEIAYSIYTGDFIITLFDQPMIQNNAGNDPTLVNTAAFNQLTNTAGISVVWDLNKLILSATGSRQDMLSLNGNFSGLNSVVYATQLSAIYLLTPTFSYGPFMVFSLTDYVEETLNNSNTLQVGMNLSYALTSLSSVTLSGGLQSSTFQDSGNSQSAFQYTSDGTIDNVTGTTGGGNYFGPFFSIGFTNKINRYFSQSMGVGVQPQSSATSNYALVYEGSYDLQWRMNRTVSSNFGVSYSKGNVSGNSPSYERVEFTAGARGPLTRRIEWKAELKYIFQSQSESAGNIVQTRCIVGIDYAF